MVAKVGRLSRRFQGAQMVKFNESSRFEDSPRVTRIHAFHIITQGSSPNRFKSTDRLTGSVTRPRPFAIMANGHGWVPSPRRYIVAVSDGVISRKDDVIDSQWDSRIRRILETAPEA